jgi:hypothetical protein
MLAFLYSLFTNKSVCLNQAKHSKPVIACKLRGKPEPEMFIRGLFLFSRKHKIGLDLLNLNGTVIAICGD